MTKLILGFVEGEHASVPVVDKTKVLGFSMCEWDRDIFPEVHSNRNIYLKIFASGTTLYGEIDADM